MGSVGGVWGGRAGVKRGHGRGGGAPAAGVARLRTGAACFVCMSIQHCKCPGCRQGKPKPSTRELQQKVGAVGAVPLRLPGNLSFLLKFACEWLWRRLRVNSPVTPRAASPLLLYFAHTHTCVQLPHISLLKAYPAPTLCPSRPQPTHPPKPCLKSNTSSITLGR